MTETLPRLDEPGDAELISAVRGGDVSAYGPLFERHVGAARRLARQLVGAADADDLVSDAFTKVLKVLQGGGGPDLAFRAYLLTAVRRLHVDKIRANSKLHTTDDLEPFDPGVPFRDTAVEGFESAAAAQAFATLPERWQAVLWHTEVEGQKPAEVAVLLGMSPNSVSALAYRAREGLRQAFLNSHISELDDDNCSWTHEHLGAYIRHGVSKRDAGKVEKHLDDCRKCMAIYLELTEVNGGLAGILAPLLLGSAGAGYLASSSLAAKGGILLFFDRAKDAIAANGQVAAVAGVAAAGVVVAGSVMTLTGGDDPRPAAQKPPAVAPRDEAPAAAPPAVRAPKSPPATKSAPSRSLLADPTPAPTEAPTADEATSEAPTTDTATSDAPTTDTATSDAPTTDTATSDTPTSDTPTTDEPATDTPSETPTTPPTYDLTLSASSVLVYDHPGQGNSGKDLWRITVQVTGLEPGHTGRLTPSLGSALVRLKGDCGVLPKPPCEFTSPRSTFTFTAEPRGEWPVWFTVRSARASDSDPTNNRARVMVGEPGPDLGPGGDGGRNLIKPALDLTDQVLRP